MARRPRFSLAGYTYHVVQRGVDRQRTFRSELDYRVYRRHLRQEAAHHDVRVHAYVLMTNHVHILATPDTDWGISRLMQAVGRRYVRYVNAAHGRTGSLWEGRFKSSLVDTDAYLLSCYRYIELNPVRAHMVESAADYPWSSAGYHIENRRDPLIADHPVFLGIAEDPEARRRYYRHYTELGDLDGHVELIRKAIRASRPFARSAFLAGVERTTGTRFPRDRKGRPHARARTLD